jgi:hypothetical protein
MDDWTDLGNFPGISTQMFSEDMEDDTNTALEVPASLECENLIQELCHATLKYNA